MHRFIRTEMLLGAEALARLRAARVVVVGLGAVGSYAVEALARAGVGALRLVDFDRVHLSNINRQLYALDSTIGRLKVEVAAARVHDINPECAVEALPLFVDEDSVAQVLAGAPDAVIDAIDSLSPKVTLLATAARATPFVVSSMGAATRTDPFAIRVSDISETDRCPLARLIRKRLRQRGIASGIRCVYSIEPPRPAAPTSVAPPAEEPAIVRRGRPRRALGSLSAVTGMFGLIAAQEVILRVAQPDCSPVAACSRLPPLYAPEFPTAAHPAAGEY